MRFDLLHPVNSHGKAMAGGQRSRTVSRSAFPGYLAGTDVGDERGQNQLGGIIPIRIGFCAGSHNQHISKVTALIEKIVRLASMKSKGFNVSDPGPQSPKGSSRMI